MGRPGACRGLHPLAAAVAAAVLLALTAPASGAGDPTREWWTIETTHFHIHYEKDLEVVATRVARLGEAIHARLVGPLGHAPHERTEVVITDNTDSANGSAISVPINTVRLFVTAPADLSTLGDYDDWYLGLLTHEYTHILHLDNVSGIPALVNVLLGKTLAPNQLQPRWIIEGIAVGSESAHTTGGRIRSTLFDAYLRADVIEDHIARLDQISSSPRRWPQGNLWYLYGARFAQWITDVYGIDTWRAVSADYGASLLPWGINRAIRRQTGRTYVQLYEGFKDHLRRSYGRQLRLVGRRGVREGKRLTRHGRAVSYPVIVPAAARFGDGGRPDQIQLVYYRNDYDSRTGQYLLRLDPRGGAAPSEQLIARTADDGPAAFGPDGDMVFSSTVPFRRVYRRTELFRLPKGKTAPEGVESFREQLTVGMRATAPSVSPDGRQVAFTVNDRGTTTLTIAALDPSHRIHAARPLVAPAARFDQAYTPRFSPDGSRVAYSSWTAGGFRDVRIVEIATGAITQITNDRALDLNPCWAPDGSKLYFSSDRSGIFNIYEYELASRRLLQVTNVATLAVMPAVTDNGKLLVYVGYSSEGYDLFVMALDRTRYLAALPAPTDRPARGPEPPAVPLRRFRYDPLPTLRPHTYAFEYAPGNFGANALTVTALGGDVVGHHAVGATIVADPAAPSPQLALDYTYGRLPFDLGLRLAYRLAPRTDYRFNDQRPEFIERSYSLRSSLSYVDLRELASQSFSFSYSAALLDSELPVGRVQPLDPYANVTRQPLRGLLGTVHLGYSISTVESGFTAGGGVRGAALRLGLDVADPVTGSEETYYAGNYTAQAYLTMPWPGQHVLALRTGGAMSQGTYSRRGSYFVGGYNLANLSLLDTVTSSAFAGAFVLRGYPPGSYHGASFLLQNAEYRIPIIEPDRGMSTLPVYLRRIDGNLFVDFGGAFNELDYRSISFFSHGAIIDSPQLHTGGGGELWLGATLGYGLDVNMRLGYAFGFSPERIPGGQLYFLASSGY